jgi:hypothetical protein
MNADMWNTVEGVVRDLLIFVGAMAILLVVLIIVVSMLLPTNPLKRILTAPSYRIGATAAVGALAVPIEPIPDAMHPLHGGWHPLAVRDDHIRAVDAWDEG